MYNLAVLVSGSGSNLQAIIDAINIEDLKNISIKLVVSNIADVMALDKAKNNNISSLVIKKGEVNKLVDSLKNYNIDGIVLAGYLPILPKEVTDMYNNKIINIHPSLIPKYCGKGFYGIHVHEAVIKNNEKETGATVHYVDSGIDTGKIIIQKKVPVFENDTPVTLQKRVLLVEHEIIIDGVKKLIENY